MRKNTKNNLSIFRQGQNVIIQNKQINLQIVFDLINGTWDYSNQNSTVLKNAFTQITLQNGKKLATNNADLKSFVTAETDDDDFGTFQKVIFSFNFSADAITVRVRLKCYHELTSILINVSLENSGHEDLSMQRADLIAVSSGSKSELKLNGEAENYHVFLNTTSALPRGVQKIYDGLGHNFSEEVDSELCYDGCIYDTISKQSFVFGFLDGRKWWSSIAIAYEKPPLIRDWLMFHNCEDQSCRSKEEIAFSPIYLNFCETPQNAYNDYAKRILNLHDRPHEDQTNPVTTAIWQTELKKDRSGAERIEKNLNHLADHFVFDREKGVQFIQISGSWQTESETGNDQGFDHFREIAKQVHEKNFKLGVHISPFAISRNELITKKRSRYFLKNDEGQVATIAIPETGEEIALFDVSNPGTQKYLIDQIVDMINSLEIDRIKVDLLPYLSGPLSQTDRFKWHDTKLTSIELYRTALSLLNRIADQSKRNLQIAICNAPSLPSVDLISQRQSQLCHRGSTGDLSWEGSRGIRRLIANDATTAPINSVLCTTESAPLVVDEPRPMNEALVAMTAIALSGNTVTISDDFVKISPNRSELLSQIFPLIGESANPIDLYENPNPQIWHLPIETTTENWDIVGLFNWEDQMDDVAFDLKDLGLDHRKYHLVHEFWNGTFLGSVRGQITLMDVPPRCARLLSIREDLGHPQLLATDVHFAQGKSEIISSGWDRRSQSLLTVCDMRCRKRGTFYFHIPEGYVPIETACHGASYKFRWDDSIHHVELTQSISDWVQICIKFTKTFG